MAEPIWLDITKPQRLPEATRATIAWRVPGKGRPLAEINLSVALIAQLGWKAGETRLRIFVSADRTMLRLAPDAEGKLLTDHGSAGTLVALLDWVTSGKRGSERVRHDTHRSGELVLTLPAWARGTAAPEPEPAPPDVMQDAAAEAKRAFAAAWCAPEPKPQHVTTTAADERSPYTEQWTPEREALTGRLWDDPEVNMTQLLARVNELPGKHIAATYLLYKHAKRLGWSNPRPYAIAHVPQEQPLPPLPEQPPEPPPPAERSAPPVNDPGAKLRLTPSATRAGEAISARDQEERIRQEVSEYLAAGKRGRAISDEMGLPLSEVLAHIAAIEARQRAGMAP